MERPSIVRRQRLRPLKLERARAMRRRPMLAERVLWRHLRGGQLAGLKFRRQQIIFGFIADFYCDSARLVVELDGEVHGQQTAYDQARDTTLARYGTRLLRLSNDEVLLTLSGALQRIQHAAFHDLSTG